MIRERSQRERKLDQIRARVGSMMGQCEMECAVSKILLIFGEEGKPGFSLVSKCFADEMFDEGLERDGFWWLRSNGWMIELRKGHYNVTSQLLKRIQTRLPEVW